MKKRKILSVLLVFGLIFSSMPVLTLTSISAAAPVEPVAPLTPDELVAPAEPLEYAEPTGAAEPLVSDEPDLPVEPLDPDELTAQLEPDEITAQLEPDELTTTAAEPDEFAAPAELTSPDESYAPAEQLARATQLEPAAVEESEKSAFHKYLESKYIDPDRVYSTDLRWWIGEASHTAETLMEEIQAMYDGGFRGVELCMQSDGDNTTNDIYAYGSAEWSYKWKLMMNKLLDLGMGVYLTSGTNWSTANLPYNPNTGEGLDPDSQAASQIIWMGTATVASGANLTALPLPATRRDVARFIGAYACPVTSENNNYISPATEAVDLTPLVTQGANVWEQDLNWTPPAGTGDWRVFAYWMQGMAQASSPAQYYCYAINYFDKRGFEALKEFWEEHYLDDPALVEKIRNGDVQLFMDSIELNSTGGVTWWAEDMREQFQERKGYDILPYIYLIQGVTMGRVMQGPGTYRLAGDAVRNQKIINDFLEVLTDIQMERKYGPLHEWMNSYGIKTRYQPSYGRTFEITEPIMYIDYVESETLNMTNQVDYFRMHAGGAKLQNKVYSCETSAASANYCYSNQLHFRDAYSFFAAGGQRIVWHIWGAGYGRANYAWPGNYAGGAGFFRFGTRHPIARDYDEFNSHLGRVQQLMQTGKARSDVGFIHNNWHTETGYMNGIGNEFTRMNHMFAHQGAIYRSTELQDNGYTYEYFSPEFLFADGVYFDETSKTIEGAGYKSLVLYQPYLDVKGAERILDWAKKGLKVVILDDAATHSAFTTNTDAELKAIIDELKTLPTVRTAVTADKIDLLAYPAVPGSWDDNVYEMLQELGVHPYAEYAEPNHQLLTQSRIDDDGNMYLYAYNYCPNDYHQNSHDIRIQGMDHGTSISTEIKMDGMFIPYKIDAWSGEVTQLANFRYENGQTVFAIDLDYDNIALFAFEAVSSEKLHIVSTDAQSSYATQNRLVLRSTESGSYTANLSNGASYQGSVTVPAPYDITNWDLTVESWTANPVAGDLYRTEPQIANPTVLTEERKTSTVKTDIDVALSTLDTWNNIPEVGKDVSGFGFYEASFNWDSKLANGAYIDFGDKLVGSMKVWINDVKVGGGASANPTKAQRSVGVPIDGAIPEGNVLYSGGVDWMTPVADIGAYLADGVNTIRIEYASDLTNRTMQMGITTERLPFNLGAGAHWGHNVTYRDYGPVQAVLVPYVDTDLIRALTVVNGSGGGMYIVGSSATATARSAPPGQVFVSWAATGVELTAQQAAQNPLTFAMPDSDVALTAQFSADTSEFTVSVTSATGGTATGGGAFTYGATATLTASPNAGYRFDGWFVNGVRLSSLQVYAFTVTASRSFEARFVYAGSGGGDNLMFRKSLESKYIDPDRAYSTEVRWWLNRAALTDETLLAEIQYLYDAGFAGVELCMQSGSNGDLTANEANYTYAYGSPEWAHKWKLMINKILDLGMTVSLTSGTHWATSNVPGLDPNSQQAMQVAAMSQNHATVTGGATFSGMLPYPQNRRTALDDPTKYMATFIGAYAYKQTAGPANPSGTTPVVIDYDSIVELTPLVTDGADVYTKNLTWTPPDNGTWRIYGLWYHGNYHNSSPAAGPNATTAGTSYAVNYFDERGVEALKEFWEANYLDDPALNKKILDGNVQLFMDSMEINAGGGFTHWAEDFAEVFEERKGYDIRPYLFLLANLGASHNAWSQTYRPMAELLDYRIDGDDDNERLYRIVYDYQDFLTTMFLERKFKPLKEWLNGVGIETRAQISYGRPFEMSEPIMYVDYPETENRVMYNSQDLWRQWAGGAKLQNKTLSSETSAQSNSGYLFSDQMHLQDAYNQFAAGIQRTIWHIWSADYDYGAVPQTHSGNNQGWPVPGAGGAGFYKFGMREPSARDYDEFNAHFGRVQQLMRTGVSRTDIGFVQNKWFQFMLDFGEAPNGNATGPLTISTPADMNRMNYQWAHQGIFYRSAELQENGYTYDYFSHKFLSDAPEVYLDETTMTIEPAGYKALVLWQEWLDVKGAETILEWARKGIPVVILDGAISYSPFFGDDDAVLKSIVDELKALPNVRVATIDGLAPETFHTYFEAQPVGFKDNVLEKLQELGVYPYAGYAEPNYQLLTQTREDNDGNRYLYVYNYCPGSYHQYSNIESIKALDHGTNIKTEIMMDGMFIPYSIDAWSGKVTQLAEYRYENGRTVFAVDLDFNNIALFAFEASDDEPVHITSTGAAYSYTTESSLVVRANKSGACTTLLSNGRTYEHNFTVPAPYNITGWDVTVESWTPGTEILTREQHQIRDPSVMTVNSKYATVKTPINFKLNTLATWNNIPEVGRDVSGTGRYTATFNWDSGLADGAYIDFGDTLIQTMKVWINGEKVGGGISSNSSKAKKSVGVQIDGEIPMGKDQYTGGVSFTKPIADVSEYLIDGVNEIIIEYSSNLTNIQLSRGVMSRREAIYGWFDYVGDYREYGPAQAVLIPFVEEEIALSYTISVSAGSGGTVTGGGEYVVGQNVVLTARPDNSYTFDGWYENNVRVSTSTTYSFIASTGRNLEARFTYSPPRGNYGGSQGKGATPAATPTPTPSAAPGEETGAETGVETGVEPGGEPAPTPSPRPQSLMTDIAPDYWAVEFIDGLVARGIVDGCPMPDGSREYRPENDITRLEMAKLIVASLELDLIYDYDGSGVFADWGDVQEWGRPYMAAAIEAGIVLGSAEEDGLYLFPDNNIIREEMIAMSVRALGAEVPEGGECEAPGFDAVSEWAMDDVAFAVENEMINLRQGNVAPAANATRAESAMILYKLIEYLGL